MTDKRGGQFLVAPDQMMSDYAAIRPLGGCSRQAALMEPTMLAHLRSAQTFTLSNKQKLARARSTPCPDQFLGTYLILRATR